MGEQKDISIYVALSFLLVVGLTVANMINSEFVVHLWENSKPIFYRGQYFFTSIGISILINILLIVAIFERTFGYKKQGSRLRSIHGDKATSSLKAVIPLGAFAYLILYLVFLSSFIDSGLTDLFTKIGLAFKTEILILVNSSFAITILFIILLIFKIVRSIMDILGRQKRLSKYPENENQLALGSVGEGESFDAEENPRWVKLKQKALNGNILVTGSIGSGKTQGSILVFVDQILKNFSPRPSMLILDPKGTFIPEVRTMATKYDLQEVL